MTTSRSSSDPSAGSSETSAVPRARAYAAVGDALERSVADWSTGAGATSGIRYDVAAAVAVDVIFDLLSADAVAATEAQPAGREEELRRLRRRLDKLEHVAEAVTQA